MILVDATSLRLREMRIQFDDAVKNLFDILTVRERKRDRGREGRTKEGRYRGSQRDSEIQRTIEWVSTEQTETRARKHTKEREQQQRWTSK